jgi:hypothetical protein
LLRVRRLRPSIQSRSDEWKPKPLSTLALPVLASSAAGG